MEQKTLDAVIDLLGIDEESLEKLKADSLKVYEDLGSYTELKDTALTHIRDVSKECSDTCTKVQEFLSNVKEDRCSPREILEGSWTLYKELKGIREDYTPLREKLPRILRNSD